MNTSSILTILQQSEYDLKYFERWYQAHKQEKLNLKPEKLTSKLKLIKIFYTLLFFVPILTRLKLILLIINPLEFLIRQSIYLLASIKLFILKLFGLKVVAIAGSFGKTSTKHILFHTLDKQISTLATAKSINTPLGIAKTILGELKLKHKLFIVELGEHKKGDIKQLCNFVKPNYGILTPIGRQHLERMGNIKNIVKVFSEILEYFKFDKSKLLIAGENKKYFTKYDLNYYEILNAKITRAGTEFDLPTGKNNQKIFSPLYGAHQAANTLPSFWLASKLNLSTEKLIKAIAQLPFIAHRHEPYFAANDVLILDNGYNSNPDSVLASLKLVNQLSPTHRIMITPGFLELGDETEKIHLEFGKLLAKEIDYLGLLDFPPQAAIMAGFKKAGGKENQIFTGKSQEEILNKMRAKIIKGSVILFENGVNEVYR